jgi:DNA-binding NarL/FixJ family response regulator
VVRPEFASSASISGRERELLTLRTGFAESRSRRALRTFRVLAAPGFGKSALLRAFLDGARADGALVIETACHPIQRDQPMSAVIGALRAAVRDLAARRRGYLSGLETVLAAADPGIAALLGGEPSPHALNPNQFETAFARLLEGVVLDGPVVLAFDDAQWIDGESVRIVEHLLASNAAEPLFFICTQRNDSAARFTQALAFVDLPLNALPEAAAQRLVRDIFPEASDAVSNSIVAYARGVPIDLVTLTNQAMYDRAGTSDAVARSLQTVVAKRLQTMEPAQRAFLQCCSLMRAPLNLRALGKLFDDAHALADAVSATSPHYLVQRGSELNFSHALIGEAVAATIDVELPLQRRILDALLEIGDPTTSDMEHIVFHARRCGAVEIEYDYCVRLAEDAYRLSAWEIAAKKFAAARDAMKPPRQAHVSFYFQYATALQGYDQDAEAEGVLRRAIGDGMAAGISRGLGVLAATLLRNLWDLQRTEAAFDTYRYYREILVDREDRAELLAIAAHMCADAMRAAEFDAIVGEFDALGCERTSGAFARFRHSEALMLMRRGRFEAARAALGLASVHAQVEPSLLAYRMPISELLVDLHANGPGRIAPKLRELATRTRTGSGGFAFAEYFAILPALAAGDWPAAIGAMAQAESERLGLIQRARLNCVPAMLWAFSLRPPPDAENLIATARELLESGMRRSGLELAPWIAAALAGDPERPNDLGPVVSDLAREPGGVSTICRFPIALALYAVRARDTALAERIEASAFIWDDTPWMRAHDLLARGYLLRSRGRSEGVPSCTGAADAFERLQAPFFAAFAAACAGTASPAQRRLLADIDVDVDSERPKAGRAAASGAAHGFTPRERQVAELAAAGRTNREIAQTLVVSERTVEVHLSNAFAKAGVSSRTKLARWMIENQLIAYQSDDRRPTRKRDPI